MSSLQKDWVLHLYSWDTVLSHSAKISYSDKCLHRWISLVITMSSIGTVGGGLQETSCENVIKAVKDAGHKKVIFVTYGCCRTMRQKSYGTRLMTGPGRASSLQAVILTASYNTILPVSRIFGNKGCYSVLHTLKIFKSLRSSSVAGVANGMNRH